jgi:hypothetical protein
MHTAKMRRLADLEEFTARISPWACMMPKWRAAVKKQTRRS